MVVVRKKKGESKDSMFRKFTRAILDEELNDEVRSRLYYVKPSQVKKEKEQMQRKRKRTRTIRKKT